MNASSRLTLLTRVGFATRGVLYIVIAVLIGRTGRAEDPSGALQYLGHGAGRPLLAIMSAGLVAYGVWRLSDAAFNIERHAPGRKGVAERIGAAASGLTHMLLAWQAVRLIQGISSIGDGTREHTRAALAMPGGMFIVALASAALFGLGAVQLVKAAKGSFLEHLEPQIARQPWALWSGRAGYAARGIIFVIIGFFLLRSAMYERANEAGGMAHAVSWLNSPFDSIIAVGLLGFGLFSLIEARFRVLHDVPVDGVIRRAVSRK